MYLQIGTQIMQQNDNRLTNDTKIEEIKEKNTEKS
jgi:hypothetical protein